GLLGSVQWLATEVLGMGLRLALGELAEAFAAAFQRVEHPRRWRQAAIGDLRLLRGERSCMLAAALALVQQCGDLTDFAQQLLRPGLQADLLAAAAQFEARLASFGDDLEEVVAAGAALALH